MKLHRVNPLVISSVTLALALLLAPATGKADSVLYFAGGKFVYDFTSNGVKSTFAGGNDVDWGPTGLAVNNAGDVFVSDFYKGNIYELAPDGTSLGTFATGLNHPTGLTFDKAGNLFVAGYGNGGSNDGFIDKFAPGGGSPSIFASQLTNPNGLTFNSAGNLFVANTGNNQVLEYSPGGSLIGGLIPVGGFTLPTAVGFDSQGNTYVVNYGGSANAGYIDKFTSTGSSVIAGRLGSPNSLAIDSSDNLFVGNTDNQEDGHVGQIYEISPDGSSKIIFANNTGGGGELAFGPSGSPASAVPEPSMLGLFGVAALVCGGYTWRRTKRTA